MRAELLLICLFCFTRAFAQSDPTWDQRASENWPEPFKKVAIPSTLDREKQAAYFFSSEKENRPLVISLHTWSGNYEQEDKLAAQCVANDYNYIHPDFRGPNRSYKACGSPYVIQDIEDAIAFAIENGRVDMNNIHVVGVSGGGYATLLAYMNTNYPVKTFSAWIPISDIKKWYYESEGREAKYARDIALSTVEGANFSEDSYYFNKEEAIARSPFYMQTPVKRRKNSKLYIYAGIHDGYTGSVPVSQSLNFYNKVVADFDPSDKESLIPKEDITELVASRNFSNPPGKTMADRKIHYQKMYEDKVSVTLFEGTHECLTDVALNQTEGSRILTIGDSNGASENGWVSHLKKLRFGDFIYNTSVSGNTIGFNNNGDTKLNTLSNIDSYMTQADKHLGGLDKIIIMLGTNDCKAVFEPEKKEVPKNMEKLITQIKRHPVYLKHKPEIYVVSPPPCATDDMMLAKYHGSSDRVKKLFTKFEAVAESNDCRYIDIFSKLSGSWHLLARDGIHPQEAGQTIISKTINEKISQTLR